MPLLSFFGRFSSMIDSTACLLLLLFAGFGFILWKWGQSFQSPHIKFSSVNTLITEKKSTKQLYANFPKKLMGLALALFSLAFIDPHYYAEKTPEEKKKSPIQQVNIPSEGIAIYLVLDQSGSMSGEVRARFRTLTKMDLLKEVTRDFVVGNQKSNLKGRPNDLLGLVTFSRGAQVLSPLTLDRQAIVDQLDQLEYTTDLNQDGTAIGYAIYKTANLIAATRHYAQELEGEGKPAYDIKSSVMILVTDGLQAPSALDRGKKLRNIELLDAARYAKEQDVRLYVINVEPRIVSKEFSAHRSLMKKAAQMTGGKFYLVDSSVSLDRIYAEIDNLEKSIFPVETQYISPPKSLQPHLYRRVSFYPYLIGLGMVALLIGVLLETTVMRRVP